MGVVRRFGGRPGPVALAVLLAAGCRPAAQPPVVVLAAASTADALTEIAGDYTRATGTRVDVSAGPSNGLARQALAGAPADVFVSASGEWADAVAEAGRAVEVRPLLSNRLVLIVPKGDPAKVAGPADLTADRVRRVALAGEEVPAGRYADESLATAGLLEPLTASGKVVRGHDVRATLAVVERGEADAGIVYATDAAASDRVAVVHEFPADSHGPIVYPAVLLEGGPAGDAGRRFYEHLFSADAAAVFETHGFRPAAAAVHEATR